jgi:hypothetical protein
MPGAVFADLDGPVPHADLDRPTGRTPLARVVEQVRGRAVDAAWDGSHGARFEVGLERQLRRMTPCPLGGLADDGVELHVLRLDPRLLAARNLDELGDEGRQLIGLRGRRRRRAQSTSRSGPNRAPSAAEVRPRDRRGRASARRGRPRQGRTRRSPAAPRGRRPRLRLRSPTVRAPRSSAVRTDGSSSTTRTFIEPQCAGRT